MVNSNGGSKFDGLDFMNFEVREEFRAKLEETLSSAPVEICEPLKGFTPKADAYQRQVIDSSARTLRIVAPAGSGKTQTVLNRVLRLVRDGLSPDRILVLTFDNSAKSSLVTKLREQLATLGADSNSFNILTLNAYGYGLLRDHIPDEYKPVIKLYRPRKLVKEVKDGLKAKSQRHFNLLPRNVKDRYYLEFFSLLKNELFDPRQPEGQRLAEFMMASPQAQPFFDSGASRAAVQGVIEGVGWLFMAYEIAMRREGVLDFDDQKLRSYLSLRDSAHLRDAQQRRFKEIIVDEFQDINRLDFALVKVLAERADLVVTGDDDQAIYGFRGCSPDFIIDLERHLGRPVTNHELRANYRNPPNLVAHSDRLIRHNERRIPKQPEPQRADRAEIKVVPTFSASLEAKFIVSFIRKVRSANPALPFSQFAVLYRTNAQSLPLQIEFVLKDIPYFVRNEDNILTNEVLERLLGFLRLKLKIQSGQQPSAKDATLTLHAYFKSIDGVTHNRLEQLFSRGDDFFEVLTSDAMLRIADWIPNSNAYSALREGVDAPTLIDTLDVMAKRFKGLRRMVGSLDDAIEDRLPLGEVYELAASFRGDTQAFVDTVENALDRARQSGAGKDEERGVALLTYFKSKGLQWHTVILTTCNEGLIPHRKAPVEDERRLFYVAMTRASANLLISYVKNACNNSVLPSRFISEAGLM